MLKLRTKTEFPVPTKRGVMQGIVRMIIETVIQNRNNIIAEGYYYYYDENGIVVQLDKIRTSKQWEDVKSVEESSMVQPLQSNTYLLDNTLQRLKEFTSIQLVLEQGENYGTAASDWEEDLD